MGFLGDLLSARFMPGIQAAAMAPFAQRAQGLLGEAPGAYQMGEAELFPGEAPIQGLGTAGSGLLSDPTNFANQMKFGLGMAALPGQYGDIGQMAVRQGLAQQLNLPMDQAKMGLDRAKFEWDQFKDMQTSQMKNAIGAGYVPGTPAYRQFVQDATMKPESQVNVLSAPTGAVTYKRPDGTDAIQYVPGSQQHTQALQGMRRTENDALLVRSMVDDIRKHGTELFGAGAAKYMTNYGQTVSVIARLRDLGVLQEGEAQRLEASLPNPGTVRSLGWSNERIAASYQNVLGQVLDTLEPQYEAYADWSGMDPRLDLGEMRAFAGGQAMAAPGGGVPPGGGAMAPGGGGSTPQRQPAPPPPTGFRPVEPNRRRTNRNR